MALKSFMVERYVPGMRPDDLAQATTRLKLAVAELSARGVLVRYLGSTFVPQEESCFCRFEAAQMESVREVNDRAAFAFARILETQVVPEKGGLRAAPVFKPFVVERHVPGLSPNDLDGAIVRLRAAVVAANHEGIPVRYLGSTLIPEDEACFCRFDAGSAAAVRLVNERANFDFARILEAELR